MTVHILQNTGYLKNIRYVATPLLTKNWCFQLAFLRKTLMLNKKQTLKSEK